ncbi:BTAD domain-containing putative transcriptional regulator [Streptosporangium sp. V21-05]|uniref:BTAD domain-containing putative transcriptional regulator n=1 Tax=Streptosporangium sp. V21-05 TaxID=3446115 RepID=UPI003F53655A
MNMVGVIAMEPVRYTVGIQIRDRRLSAGLGQRELADLAGVSERSLRDIEADRVNRPRASSLHRLAKALGITDDDLRTLLTTARAATTPATADPVHIDVLGPLSVRRGGAPHDIRSAMQRELLGLLAVQPSRQVSREEIVDVLWEDRPPKTYLSLVQSHIGSLRRLLQPRHHPPAGVIVLTQGGYTLELGAGRLDLTRFDELWERARTAQDEGHLTSARELFGQALRCWRGPVLANTGSRLRHHPATVALNQRRTAAGLTFADLAFASGHYRSAAAQLRVLAGDEPMHEGLQARLVLAMAGGGEQAAALRLFDTVRARLAAELGVEPGHELTAAHLQVLRQQFPGPGSGERDTALMASGGNGSDPASARPDDAPGSDPASARPDDTPGSDTGPTPPAPHQAPSPDAAAPSPPAPVSDANTREAAPAQLPLDARGFAGRLRELAQLDAFWAAATEQPAALTVMAVSGTAGVGKTTLAVHWAHRVRDRFPDGQLYVNLRGFDATGSAMEPAEAVRSFLDALQVPTQRIPPTFEAQTALYRSLLAGRRILVVLDNARDVEQVRPLLPGTASCLVVVTSRNQLSGLVATEGAHSLALDLLSADEGRELLARRVGAERVAAEPEAVDAIIARCSRLPLALAIVTARAIMNPRFSLATLANELHQASGGLDAFHGSDPATQVRVVFSWSYRTLGGEAARLFRLLAIHPGPDIGIGAAARLADLPEGRVRSLLAELVGAHLISEHTAGRYAFHDLLRLYAAERDRDEDSDDERGAATGRLYDHYLRTAIAAAQLLYPHLIRLPRNAPPPEPAPAGPDEPGEPGGALAWLDAEHVNLVAAVTHAAQHGPRPAAWFLADTLRGYLARRQHSIQWLTVTEAGLDAARAEGDLYGQAALHLSTAHAYHTLGRRRQAIVHLGHVADFSRRAGWEEGQVTAFLNTGAVYGDLGQLEDATENLLRALDLRQRIGPLSHHQVIILNNLGDTERIRGRLEEAAGYLIRALDVSRRIGSGNAPCMTLCTIGQVYHDLGRFSHGADYLYEAMNLARRTGDHAGEVDSLASLSRLHRDAGRVTESLDFARTAFRLSEDVGHHHWETVSCNALAASYDSLGRHQEAVDLYTRGLLLARKASMRYAETEALIGLSSVNSHLGNHDEARAFGHDALAMARNSHFRVREGQALTTLAEIHLNRDELAETIDRARQAIDLHRDSGHRLGEARALTHLGTASRHISGGHVGLRHWREALAIFTDIGAPETDHVRALVEGGEKGR